MLLVEYTILDKLQVINETTESGQNRLKLRGRFQKCDEQNNNGRIYPRKILEGQVQKIQEKINDRSLVGALDHPANDAIHLSQASHLITGLSVDKSGDVIGECEILSTPNGKIVEALINDGVKIGISSRGVGSVSEGREGKIVNEDFKLITFDLVSDPSTKGAFPELTESIRENSQRAQEIISKHKKDRVLITMLESKINEAMNKSKKKTKPTNKYESEEIVQQDPKKDLDKLKVRPKRPKSAAQRDMERQEKLDKVIADREARRRRRESIEIFNDSLLEGLKKVCWGDRYDEGEIKRRNKAHKLRMQALAGSEGKRSTGAENVRRGRKNLQKRFGEPEGGKFEKAKRDIAKGKYPSVPPGPADQKSSRTYMRQDDLRRKYGEKKGK